MPPLLDVRRDSRLAGSHCVKKTPARGRGVVGSGAICYPTESLRQAEIGEGRALKIAVLGWGSLIWCPGSLALRSRWHKDGPRLPIEFAHISEDCRLTLVIHAGSREQTTYWALSDCADVDSAANNLKQRENCRKLCDIHYVTADGQRRGTPETVATVKQWMKGEQDIDASIWTGLNSNWVKKGRNTFSPDDALAYLEGLAQADRTAFQRAREYVCNTPPQIQTEVRRLLKHKDGAWSDNRLPRILFAPARGPRRSSRD